MEYVEEITRDEIRNLINQDVTDLTGYSLMEFDSLEQAIEASVEAIYEKANDFEVLTQEMIDEQIEQYDGYLDGAKVGDLVWGDSEMWVSQSTVDGWYYREQSDAHGKHLDVSDIESLVCDFVILDRLDAYNKKN